MIKRKNLFTEQLECRTLMAVDVGQRTLPPQPPTPPTPPSQPTPSVQVAPASFDGTGNNPLNSEWGSTGERFLRRDPARYADGISALTGTNRPSARVVSNAVAAQSASTTNDRGLTNMTYVWGQFIDHDIDLTNTADPVESAPITIPTGDPYFDPNGTGTKTMSLSRSIYDPATGTSRANPRQQTNAITAFIDGSMVYGSDQATADSLRTFSGGKLRTSDGNLLPLDPATGNMFFVAGDVRVNENVALISMQTLWLREHNRLADRISAENPQLSDEQVFQRARALVRAEIQAITYNEFLPSLLGQGAIGPYRGYNPRVNPGVDNMFATAAFRFGHSMISTEVPRMNNDGTTIAEGNLALRDSFFATSPVMQLGIDALLKGATVKVAQEIDTKLIDDLRNFLFGPPGSGGFDLASLNIQRGRDHGLANYNEARRNWGLRPVRTFEEITSDAQLAATLRATYGTVDNIDVWVGGLAENHVPGSSMGPLFRNIIADQFQRLRDGDRYWYQNVFQGAELDALQRTSLSDVIARNSGVTGMPRNVFMSAASGPVQPQPGQPQPGTRPQPPRPPQQGPTQVMIPPGTPGGTTTPTQPTQPTQPGGTRGDSTTGTGTTPTAPVRPQPPMAPTTPQQPGGTTAGPVGGQRGTGGAPSSDPNAAVDAVFAAIGGRRLP